MNIQDILPVFVPGIMIQIGIQAYFIKHCWENEALTQKQKALYTILMAVFNLPAVALYMFFRGRKPALYSIRDLDSIKTDDGVRQGVFVLLVIVYEGLSLNMFVNGPSGAQSGLVTILLSAVFVLAIIGGLFVKPQQRPLYFALPAAETIMILIVNYIDYTANSQFIVLAVVASVINGYSLKHAKVYSLCAFVLYIVMNIVKIISISGIVDENSIVGTVYANLIIFILVFAAFYAIKKQILLNGMLNSALEELKDKSQRLEEMGAVAERSRIAAEIHDTVGHKLTAAVISIEAGERLLESDKAQAREKLKLAQEQVKQGLQSIRLSVRAVKQGVDEQDFEHKVNELLSQIRKDTGLNINAVVDMKSKMLPLQQRVLLGAVVECATNSIKHGASDKADLLIQHHKGVLRMTFSDEGKGAGEVVLGFGLSNMRERVEGLGGTFSIESEKGEGFTVNIAVPTGEGGDGI